jgi:hypothetical protein
MLHSSDAERDAIGVDLDRIISSNWRVERKTIACIQM